jgi:single-strand DNA-binding protein
VFNQNLIKVVKNYLQKGSKVYLEGALETRSWENKDGVKQYTTEIVIKKYNGEITMLDSKDGGKFQDKLSQSNDDLDQVPF